MRSILRMHDLNASYCVPEIFRCQSTAPAIYQGLYQNILKYASIAFCANCGLWPIDKSFSVNTWLFKLRLFVVTIRVLFPSNYISKNVFGPHSLDAFCILI